MRSLPALWSRRSLRFRITMLATVVTLAVLLVLAGLGGRLLGPLLTKSVDEELAVARAAAVAEVESGEPVDNPPGLRVRVLDTAGRPTDGGRAAALDAPAVRTLKSGLPVSVAGDPPVRWHGTVATAPDGAQRLVVAGTGLVGFAAVVHDASRWLLGIAGLGAVTAGLTTWFAVGSALRPVSRMRRALRRLGPEERLPLPPSEDELRALADEFNGLLARQREATDKLRRFTGDAAHELRSPVTSIRAQAEVAVANPDPDTSHDVLTDVLTESERLSALLDGLLALARSDAGERPAATPVELVSESRAAVRRCSAESLLVRVSAPGGEVWAAATHSEVELVLDNLLRNACGHAHAQVVLSVLGAGSWARVVVDDDGPGIPAEHRERVFDRFYRVTDDRARTSGGSGLGLALVAELVRRRGGRVATGDSPDGGARFVVVWQAAEAV
ncbi:HAMP domain-containing protein [Haloechinothrix sp. YIM 98757]|uniref:histidine kinase n=1 Tax=Haloechinothrix aidingensis TaxID=2752311 RepID=A0A837ZUP2_9PSEU|nr:ATP-binding protein [Haloechinothrix aidingensis]MBA0124316.1 HAMP domain-containing protein [Haloechinothrix aidingensis]